MKKGHWIVTFVVLIAFTVAILINNFAGATKVYCQITKAQEAALAKNYTVSETTRTINGKSTLVVEVSGKNLSESQLKKLLAIAKQDKCKISKQAHLFFLPLLPQVS